MKNFSDDWRRIKPIFGEIIRPFCYVYLCVTKRSIKKNEAKHLILPRFALFHYPHKPFYNVTSICTVDLLVPMTDAHVRTVLPVFTIYFPHRTTRSSIDHIKIPLFPTKDILIYVEKREISTKPLPLRLFCARRPLRSASVIMHGTSLRFILYVFSRNPTQTFPDPIPFEYNVNIFALPCRSIRSKNFCALCESTR